MIDIEAIELVAGGLGFPEGPRWRDGKLWFSDLREGIVRTLTPAGATRIRLRHAPIASGIGFLDDGTPVFSSMRDKRIVRLEGTEAALHADLGEFPGDFLNDLITDDHGNAYVGTRTRNMSPWGAPGSPGEGPDCIVLVRPDGRAEIVAEGLTAPNGMVITPDGRTLIVAETYGRRLTAYLRHADGTLGGARIFAALDGVFPDGIALDAEGAVWVGSPYGAEFVRVHEGGRISDRLSLPGAVACAFGGPNRSTLFLLCVDPAALPTADGPAATGQLHGGSIYAIPCAIGGAGIP